MVHCKYHWENYSDDLDKGIMGRYRCSSGNGSQTVAVIKKACNGYSVKLISYSAAWWFEDLPNAEEFVRLWFLPSSK